MTAVGVLNIVFGGIFIITSLIAIMMVNARLSQGLSDWNAIKLLGQGLLSLAVGIVGLIAGIVVLRLIFWGRIMSLIFAGMWVLYALLATFFPVSTGASETSGATFDIIGRVIGLLISLVYPVILYRLFQRPQWKAAFITSTSA